MNTRRKRAYTFSSNPSAEHNRMSDSHEHHFCARAVRRRVCIQSRTRTGERARGHAGKRALLTYAYIGALEHLSQAYKRVPSSFFAAARKICR